MLFEAAGLCWMVTHAKESENLLNRVTLEDGVVDRLSERHCGQRVRRDGGGRRRQQRQARPLTAMTPLSRRASSSTIRQAGPLLGLLLLCALAG